nr:hypothetical protein [Streptomyces chartreusis]
MLIAKKLSGYVSTGRTQREGESTEPMYNRMSRECAIHDLDPRLRASLMAEAEAESLSPIMALAICCVETHSVPYRQPGVIKRLLGGPLRETLTAAVLLPKHLVVAVADIHTGSTTARSRRLTDITIALEDDSRLATDSGVTLLTRWAGTSEGGASYVALGEDAAGAFFKEVLTDAIREAKAY